MKLSSPRIIAIAIAATLAACGGSSSNHSDAPKAPPADQGSGDPSSPAPAGNNAGKGSDAKPATSAGAGKDAGHGSASGAGSSSGAGSTSGTGSTAVAGYAAKGGDVYVLNSQAKNWSGNQAEPDFQPASDASMKVLGLYKAGSRCKYRLESTSSTVSYAFDVGCEVLSCADNNCTSKAIDPQDVGDFKAAKGTEMTCLTTQTVGASKNLVKTVTKSWTHADALREGQGVKSEMLSCSLPLVAGEDTAALDPCNAPAGRIATKSRNVSEIKSQVRGAGTPEITREANFKFTATGALAEPTDAKFASISCTLAPPPINTISVTMSKASCDANHSVAYSLMSVSGIPKALGGNLLSTANGVNYNAGASFYTTKTAGSCHISVQSDGDPLMLNGTVTCDADSLTSFAAPGTESLKDVSFSCFAPAGL